MGKQKMEESEIREMIKPIMQNMLLDVTKNQPKNPSVYMINWLQKQGGYTSNGLTWQEKSELEKLRVEIKKYREFEGVDEINKSCEESDEDDDECIDDEEIQASIKKAQSRMSVARTAVSAEVYGAFNEKKDFVARKIEKSDDQVQRIKARILQSFLFQNLEAKDLNIVIDAMEEQKVEQGENGDCLYFIEEGSIECFKRFANTTEDKLLKEYQPGEAFGELALLYNAPRAATLISKTNCILWCLDRECFNNIVKVSAQKKRERYETFLKSVNILSEVDSFELGQISDALRSSHYSKGEFVIREGELGDVFYIIENGTAAATKTMEPGKPPVEVKAYNTGDYFGELALVKGDPRAANIVATADLRVISLDRNSFKRLLGPIEDILKRNADAYTKYIK